MGGGGHDWEVLEAAADMVGKTGCEGIVPEGGYLVMVSIIWCLFFPFSFIFFLLFLKKSIAAEGKKAV